MKFDFIKQIVKSLYEKGGVSASLIKLNENTVIIKIENQNYEYVPHIKNIVNKENIGTVILNLRETQTIKPVLLFSQYINPEIAEILKSNEIYFMDASTNAYLKGNGLHLYIKGNKQAGSNVEKKIGSSFTFSEMQMLFLFLTCPTYLKKNQREIANTLLISLGAVNNTIRNLIKQNFISKIGKQGLMLTNKEKAFNRWVEIYISKYRNKFIIKKYKAQNSDWWKDCQISKYQSIWGGEISAKILVHIIKPEEATIYTNKIDPYLIANYKLIEDPNGNVTIIRKFWNFHIKESVRANVHNPIELAPAIITYADLVATHDERCLEAASMIYKDIIHPSFNSPIDTIS